MSGALRRYLTEIAGDMSGQAVYIGHEILNCSEEEFKKWNALRRVRIATADGKTRDMSFKRAVEEYREDLKSGIREVFLKSRNDRLIYNTICSYLIKNSTGCDQDEESDDDD
jgi:hypothetical protein